MNKHQIFNHLMETFQYIGGLNGSDITMPPDLSVISGYLSPVFNFVRFDTKNHAKINQLKSRNIPFMCLPSKQMEVDFEQFVQEQGLHNIDLVTASFKDLQNFEYTPSLLMKIRNIEKEDELLIFDEISSQVFSHHKMLAFNFLKPVLNSSKTHLLLAYVEEVPVGCAMLSLIGGEAGSYWIGVFPNFRNKGIGTELAKYQMNMAKTLGKKIIVAHNMTPSLNLYQHLGFTQTGQLPLYACDKQFFIF
ncbi:MAG: GNAT family N-acetyltransferase [Pseudomonadota bacterium]|nr:GNAT family N-acetyltransferase [Alphaproteobacteria bacterium]